MGRCGVFQFYNSNGKQQTRGAKFKKCEEGEGVGEVMKTMYCSQQLMLERWRAPIRDCRCSESLLRDGVVACLRPTTAELVHRVHKPDLLYSTLESHSMLSP